MAWSVQDDICLPLTRNATNPVTTNFQRNVSTIRSNARIFLHCVAKRPRATLRRIDMPQKQPNVIGDESLRRQSHVEIDGVKLHLCRPHDATGQWIGQQEILHQLLACWLVVDENDLPLTPRLIGPPGIGKTALGT